MFWLVLAVLSTLPEVYEPVFLAYIFEAIKLLDDLDRKIEQLSFAVQLRGWIKAWEVMLSWSRLVLPETSTSDGNSARTYYRSNQVG